MIFKFAFLAAPAAAGDRPGWLQLRVGQMGNLNAQLESDIGAASRPVCRSYYAQIAYLRGQNDDCPHRRWGTVVEITEIRPGFNDDRTTALSS